MVNEKEHQTENFMFRWIMEELEQNPFGIDSDVVYRFEKALGHFQNSLYRRLGASFYSILKHQS